MPPDLQGTGRVGASEGLKCAVPLSLRARTLREALGGRQRWAAFCPGTCSCRMTSKMKALAVPAMSRSSDTQTLCGDPFSLHTFPL